MSNSMRCTRVRKSDKITKGHMHVSTHRTKKDSKIEPIAPYKLNCKWRNMQNVEIINFNHPEFPIITEDVSNTVLLYITHSLTKISKNNFASWTNLMTLDLSCNHITTIYSSSFNGLSKLEKLDLSHNKIKSLPDGTFDELHNLKDLILTNNKLKGFPPKIFDKLTSLKTLELNSNPLRKIQKNIFNCLTSLKSLNIAYTKTHTLPDHIFGSLFYLRRLHLGGNKLTSLPIEIFAYLPILDQLYINNNQLSELPWNIFSPLTQLTKLSIANNQIANLPEKIFASLTNLHTLYMHCNQLTNLPENIFASLTNLRELDASYNLLTSLSENIFTPLTNLQGLYINANKLTSLSENICTPLTNLEKLYIHVNKLTSLPASILGCRRLTLFHCYDNELTLDIRFERFIQRIRNYKNHGIFNDGQNIHASSIQTSTKESINALFKDTFTTTKDEIVKECLTWEISYLPHFLTYLDDKEVHSTLLVSFYDVFVKVFGRIMSHPNKMDIIHRLDEELKESECKCFTGRLTRLVNCLVGFYDDIVIGISNSERIGSIILSTLAGEEMNDDLKKICIDKLKAIDISDEEITKWLA